MPIYVVSDLHGVPDQLVKTVPEGATLLLLGDLINFIDYTSMTGILVDVFSVEAVEKVVRLRAEGDFERVREAMIERTRGREEEVRTEIGKLVREQYEAIFAILPEPTYLILGNVDNPRLVTECLSASPAVHDADGRVLVLEGERFGFVGGALPTPLNVAGEITEDRMREKVENLGPVDVLCSHIPPAVPDLCFDTLAGKAELGSKDLLEYIEEYQPRRAYFGHVHQPLLSLMHIGRTLCINVGYFRSTKRAFPHRKEERV